MAMLGVALASMHAAHRRFDTVSASCYRWYDARARYAALDHREMQGLPGFTVLGSRWDEPDETVSRLWVQLPDRLRAERSSRSPGGDGGAQAALVAVVDGQRWWTWDALWGTRYGAGDDILGFTQTHFEELLDPRLLLSSLRDFAFQGSTQAGGRQAWRLGARHGGRDLPVFDTELVVDGERGVVLRMVDRFQGVEVERRELGDVRFDGSHPPGTFAFVPHEGDTPLPMPRAQTVTVDEAVRAAPFTVFVPAGLPQGWQQRAGAGYCPGWWPHGRHGPEVTLACDRSDPPRSGATLGRHTMSALIRQYQGMRCADGPRDWEVVTRNGTDMLVAAAGRQVQAQLQLQGTNIDVTLSGARDVPLDPDVAVDVAMALVPAPTPAGVPADPGGLAPSGDGRDHARPAGRPDGAGERQATSGVVTPAVAEAFALLYAEREHPLHPLPITAEGAVVDPGRLVALMDVTVLGHVDVGARRAVSLLAREGPSPLRFPRRRQQPRSPRLLREDVDDLILDVDAQRGVLLRARARRAGQPVVTLQLRDVAFDD